MKKRLWAVALTVLLSGAVILAGCGKAEKAVITVAMDDSYPPMEYHDKKTNELVGFDVDLARALGEKLGKKIEFQSVAWEGIFLGLESGRYDVVISSVSMTPDRVKNYEFTKPYLANGQVIVAKPGEEANYKTPDDLAGKNVGVQTDTTADTACKKKLEEKGKDFFSIKRYDEIIQTFEAMSAGHIDVIVVDYAVAIEYAGQYPEKYAISSAQLTNEPISICFKKGNTKLRDDFQKALDELKKEGKLAELSKKWLGDDFTSNINENLY